MKVETKTTSTLPRTDYGYRFAKDWCELQKKQGYKYKMSETETTIILEEYGEYFVDIEEDELK